VHRDPVMRLGRVCICYRIQQNLHCFGRIDAQRFLHGDSRSADASLNLPATPTDIRRHGLPAFNGHRLKPSPRDVASGARNHGAELGRKMVCGPTSTTTEGASTVVALRRSPFGIFRLKHTIPPFVHRQASSVPSSSVCAYGENRHQTAGPRAHPMHPSAAMGGDEPQASEIDYWQVMSTELWEVNEPGRW
jgi:hypothetical protein